MRHLKNQDTEESVSDTYKKVWDTTPPMKHVHLFALLAKICRNFAQTKLVWKSAVKYNADVASLTQEMEMYLPDTSRNEEIEVRELDRTLNSFLRTLSNNNQMVFLCRY